MEWFNLRLNGMVYHVIFIPLLNRLVDIDYPYISDYPSYCIVNLGALAHDNINNNHFIDSFCVLHPATTRFSWHRRGFTATRLDRIYLPPPLESAPRVARYIPTTSYHHAYLLKLDKTGLSLPDSERSSTSFY